MEISHQHSSPNGQYQHSHVGGDATHRGGNTHQPDDTYLGYWRGGGDGALTFIRPSGIVAEGDVPVYASGEKKDASAGDPRFHAVLKEMGDTHDRKQQDYGTDGDPFANMNAAAEFGIAPWVGAYVRINDKITRIKSFLKKGRVANESIEDSLIDIATYAAIALVLYREDQKR
jgi:hypothetical protein